MQMLVCMATEVENILIDRKKLRAVLRLEQNGDMMNFNVLTFKIRPTVNYSLPAPMKPAE